MITLTKKELQAALATLDKYYGISEEMLSPQCQSWLVQNTTSEEEYLLKTSWSIEPLYDAFEPIGDYTQHTQILKSLILLTSCILESPRLQGTLYTKGQLEEQKRKDYLRLYILAKSTKNNEGITIRNNSRKIHLNNSSNWFVQELLMPFLEDKLSAIGNLEVALEELDVVKPAKKGRRASDPRVSILLWGTYQMLSDELTLASPMPNSLCNFIITLLQLQKVLPLSPVIDSFWVRAQLRYIRARATKPRFPLGD